MSKWISLGLGVILVAFVAVLATREPAQNTLAKSPLIGRPAPEVIGTGLDGSTVRLSSLSGRYVVVNFFATWCTPCLLEHDDLLRFAERHKEAGDAAIVAVLFDDEPENARAFFEKRGGDWPVIEDKSGKVALDFGVRGPPESYVIGPDGTVLAKYLGQITDTGLDSVLAQAEAASP
jgi:cytochrome c biogenesis protein CcmG/thiol:disulfide interchange protein DsbE